MRCFKNNDAGYLAWTVAHPNGFIVNVDEPQTWPDYPMVHSVAHKSMTTAKRSNYTTGRYYKICSDDLSELEEWSKENHGKRLTFCQSPKCSAPLGHAALSKGEMEKLWS